MGEVINSNDVGVTQVALDFDFPCDLTLHLLIESLLLDDLEAADEVGGHMLHKVNLSIAALIDISDDPENLLLAVQGQYFEGLFLAL